jgi:hypothetical protein
LLLSIQITHIASFITKDGIIVFMSYFSCWNYIINAVYYVVVCAGMKGIVAPAAVILTPFMIAVNAMWISLCALILLFGATFKVEKGSGSDMSVYVDMLEDLASTMFSHVSPLATSIFYFVYHLDIIRVIYARTKEMVLTALDTFATVCMCIAIAIIPWLLFMAYILAYNPEERYGYAAPTPGMLAFAACITVTVYSLVLTGIYYLAFSVKFGDRGVLKTKRKSTHRLVVSL